MPKSKKFSKEKNGGYTLVEIIVSVVILAIVIVPLLNAFLSVIRLNARSKTEQEATAVAQNLMETVKAVPLEELISTAEASSDVERVDKDEDAGKYSIYYTTYATNGKNYRVVASLDAGAYRKSVETDDDEYNDMSLASVDSMSEETDAFFIQELTADGYAASYLASVGEDADTVYAAMTRKITVDIKKVSEKTNVAVSVVYEYNGEVYSPTQNILIYSGTQLKNIFIFFQPMYTSNGVAAKESIQINNEANIPLNTYLVKQSYSSATALQEMNYRVAIDVTEPYRTVYTDGGAYAVMTDLQTNLDTAANQVSVTYGGSSGKLMDGNYYSAEKLVGLDTDSSLVKENKSDRIYSVSVSVYNTEDDAYADALVTLTGTKEE